MKHLFTPRRHLVGLFALLTPALFLLTGISQCGNPEDVDDDGDEWTENQGDCDDADASVFPGATEVCDGIDQDCNGLTDEGVLFQYFIDGDLDGFGDPATETLACKAPSSDYIDRGEDCDDRDGAIHPGALELCNGWDDDCNSLMDDNDPGVQDQSDWYLDEDRDGFGTLVSTVLACFAPEGFAPTSDDCNDFNSSVHPNAPEICDELDNDCGGVVDEGVTTRFYFDGDLDGFGIVATFIEACIAPDGYSEDSTDCNDNDAQIHPFAPERCNFLDDDCNATSDDGVLLLDADAGNNHSMAICSDGSVWTWGYNNFGQLGDGTTTQHSSAITMPSFLGATMVAGGGWHSLALKSDGTVWGWGQNNLGQTGDPASTTTFVPVKVASLSGVVAIAAGTNHSLALKSDGTVWAWGSNTSGQLGDGTTTSRTTPVQVSGLTGVVSIAAGDLHSLAVRSDGTAWGWGNNSFYQLGDGTITPRKTPVQVSGLTNVKEIDGGMTHSVALKNDGTVWAWGANSAGQLGDGTTTSRSTPVQVSGLSSVNHVIAGGYHNIALMPASSVLCWGRNAEGQLGDGTTTNRTTPVASSGVTSAREQAAGQYHSFVRRSDQTVWSYGSNNYGQLGDGTTTNRTSAVTVLGLPHPVPL